MQTDTPAAASSPSQTDPLRLATAAAAKALPSSLPSSEMSMTPERSEKRPARAQKMSGVASRRVASRVSRSWNPSSLTPALPVAPRNPESFMVAVPGNGASEGAPFPGLPALEHKPSHAGASRGRRRDRCAIRRASGGFSIHAQRPREQDDEPLDDQQHVAGDGPELQIEFAAALVEGAEQQAREHDPDRMVAAHQRDRDAGEAVSPP